METKNVKSLKQLVVENNAVIDIMENSKGKFFFVCGKTNGYVSDPAIEIIKKEGFSNPETFQFAECLNETSGEWIPQIMKAPSNRITSFGADLLH